MDELWLETPSVTEFSDDVLKSLVCIDLLLPTSSRRKDKTREQDVHAWKDHVVSTKPALVKDAYLYLAEAGLEQNNQHSSGLYALLNDAAFVPFRGEIAAHLLKTYPSLSPHRLEELLQVALTQSPRMALMDLARTKLDPATPVSEKQRQLWGACGLFIIARPLSRYA